MFNFDDFTRDQLEVSRNVIQKLVHSIDARKNKAEAEALNAIHKELSIAVSSKIGKEPITAPHYTSFKEQYSTAFEEPKELTAKPILRKRLIIKR